MPNRVRAIFLSVVVPFLVCGARGHAAEPSALPARPWIGITSTVDENNVVCPLAYVQAVTKAGGLPVVIPPLESLSLQNEYLQRLDGLVLIGGWDIPPAAYGEEIHPTTEEMPPIRWQWEHRLIHTWLKSQKPMLGICLGAQMTNVVKGGTLIQDIPSEVGQEVIHRNEPAAQHPIRLQPETRLHQILGVGELVVNSSHHQAVERIGDGLIVAARSADGVVEALETPGDRWLLLLQWHPERMEEQHHAKIFGAFVDACK